MFKKFIIISCFSLLFFSVVFAQDIGIGPGSTAENVAKEIGYTTEGITDTTLSETVGRYIYLALTFVGIVFLLLTLYAGYLWMFGGGNESNIEKAKGILSSSVVGLVITMLSYGITALILSYVAGTRAPEPGEEIYTQRQTYVGCCISNEVIDEKTGKVRCYDNDTQKNCTDNGGRYMGDRTACSQFSNCGSVSSRAQEF